MKNEPVNCSDCDFVEIWPSYDEQRCKHHKLRSGDRKIPGKKIPKWCPLLTRSIRPACGHLRIAGLRMAYIEGVGSLEIDSPHIKHNEQIKQIQTCPGDPKTH